MATNTNTIIKGDNLMLFDSAGKSIAFATSHVLTMTGDAIDISSKDHGKFNAKKVNKINWEIQSENLYTTAAFDNYFTLMLATEPITVMFGLKAEADDGKTVADGDYTNWSKGTTYYEGKAFITSLTANAATGENATFSITLTGSGKIEKKTAAA